jgi:hypothetical protein
LANNKAYGEPLLPKPFTIIQTARGCPYQCNFCVKSYGGKLTEKSPEYIIKEIKYAVENNHIKTFRFIDDTFTINKKRVLQICSLIIENQLNLIQWTCLSRIDSIDLEMAEIMKKPVTQVLSNGEVIKDFKVGDVPYTPACDYMASCDYQCSPDADITESNTNALSYGEAFMNMNNDKITQKIKMLMKERFFYVKKDLLAFIQVPKAYSLIQIYAALTEMMEENEVITDRYGRSGYLVNIGEYYLFQPLELTDQHISIFDRSVPIDYKHQMIRFDLKEGEKEETKKIEKEEGEGILDEYEFKLSGKEKESVFNQIRNRFEFVQDMYQSILQHIHLGKDWLGKHDPRRGCQTRQYQCGRSH